MKKKGFTLVELLAVIVVLGIILLIAVPKLINTINSSKLATLDDTVKMIAKTAEREYVTRTTLGNLDQVGDPITCDDVVSLSSNDYSDCEISFTGDVAYVSLVGTGNFSGYSCTDGTKDDANCGTTVINADISGANPPILASNMIPVMYKNNKWVKADENNESGGNYIWYDYENKKWANVVVVTDASRNTYKIADTGTEVLMNDILAFFVWIPRYKYAIPSGSGARSINIVFESKSAAKSNGNAVDASYRTHSTFTFDSVEKSGIWVGKFEITGDSTNITVKPNLSSVRNESISSFFTKIKNMEAIGNPYGFDRNETDVHMMLNSDWGAITYLSMSVYGKNSEVYINNSSTYTTGCSGNTVTASSYAGCQNAYDSSIGPNASTTGNIYGVYDMAGGSYEFIMGNYGGYSGYSIINNSGFNGPNGYDGSTTTGGVDFPASKYFNLYTSTDAALACDSGVCYGHALSETAGWNLDYASMGSASYPWSSRGGLYPRDLDAGIFRFMFGPGKEQSYNTTRISIINN